MTVFVPLDPSASILDFGFIPGFLHLDDPRSAAQQFDERYQGGWRHQAGITLSPEGHMLYPGDPPQKPIAALIWRTETIVLYPYGYIAIIQKDGSYEACRMD
jgi:hypothetical protein